MTVIIGMEHEGKVYMGADSASKNGALLRPLQNPKIFRTGEFLIGVTGTVRLIQLLRYNTSFPAREEGETDEQYLVVKFAESIRTCLRDHGYSQISENHENYWGSFLVGYRGHLWGYDGGHGLARHPDGIDTTGVGDEVALGAMLALEHLGPEERIRRSLEIVGAVVDGVMPPYSVEVLG